MPKLSAWAARAALLYFAGGTALGALLLAGKAAALPSPVVSEAEPWLWALRPLHVEALLFGFVVQLVFGVAFWILPRTPVRPSGRPVGLALVLLNAGVWLVAAAVSAGVEGLAVAGRGCEAAACGIFAHHAWPRVRATRRHGEGRRTRDRTTGEA
jgi:cbb3-type cytochrome oxidase subunit 1